MSLITALESNGLDDALWCLRAVDGFDREIRLFAVACARDVQHLMRDERSINALDVAERYANGEATNDELIAALDAAWAARSAAMDSAARDAAYTAEALSAAAYAAWCAARYAAWDAADAAWAVARYAAWDAIRSKQEQRFREMVTKAEGLS